MRLFNHSEICTDLGGVSKILCPSILNQPIGSARLAEAVVFSAEGLLVSMQMHRKSEDGNLDGQRWIEDFG